MQSAAAFSEDLPRLAEFEFKTALKSCAGCTDYHALFGYDRLAGRKMGINIDADPLSPLLARYAQPGARILIAGAADSGLLALIARATLGRQPEITVADRCATPLIVCRAFAESHGLNIRTVQADLSAAHVPERYDLIFSHGILLYIPPDGHPSFLRNLAQSLSPNGVVLLVNWKGSRSGRDASPQDKRKDIADVLKTQGIALPEDEAAFRQRIARHDEAHRKRSHLRLEAGDIEANIRSAGLRVLERQEHDKRVGPGSETDTAHQARTYFFILSPA